PEAGNPAIGLIPKSTTVDDSVTGTTVELCPTVDQRGLASASGGACDAGSVQLATPVLSGGAGDAGSVQLATPVLSWGSPPSISFGTPLGSVLDASSGGVAGSFAYTAQTSGSSPVAVSAASVLTVGVYTLTATFTASSSSSPSYVSGGTVTVTLRVSPAEASVTASSGSFTYGGTPPVITASFSGLVDGDTAGSLAAVTSCSTTATSVSPPGSYPSSCSVKDPNYTFGYSDGVVRVLAAPAGPGYWLAGSGGGVFSFDAPFYGSMGGRRLDAPVVGVAVDPCTGGYWLAGSDGGVFAFDAPFYGSMVGRPLDAPVVGIAAYARYTSSGQPFDCGYWLAGSDGGVFSFNAPFYGSMGGRRLDAPVVGITADPLGGGYWLAGSDGGVFSFDAPFYGSMVGRPLDKPVTAIAAP
ncbi:MAG: MBG domain-containing protein, partial [Acidimicrobiales bacterium]